MVAGVIVCVAAQNVENYPAKQFQQGARCLVKIATDDLGQVVVARIASHHFIHAKEGEGGHQRSSLPAIAGGNAIKALYQEYIFVGCARQFDRCSIEAASAQLRAES